MFDDSLNNDECEFISVPNLLKDKVGSNGLSKDVLTKAQNVLEKKSVEFRNHIFEYIEELEENIDCIIVGSNPKSNGVLAAMDAAVQLKAHGRMLKQGIITDIGHSLSSFLSIITVFDDDALDICNAHAVSLRISASGDLEFIEQRKMMLELSSACNRYFATH